MSNYRRDPFRDLHVFGAQGNISRPKSLLLCNVRSKVFVKVVMHSSLTRHTMTANSRYMTGYTVGRPDDAIVQLWRYLNLPADLKRHFALPAVGKSTPPVVTVARD